MATDKELYERALAKVGDPQKAAELVAAYREAQGATAPAPTPKPAVPAAVRRMASAEPPKGGPVGTRTKPSMVAVKEVKVEPLGPVAPPKVDVTDYVVAPSPASARMADRTLLADAERYGKWAAMEAARKDAAAASSPFSSQSAQRGREEAARYYGPAMTGANEQFNRDWAYGAKQVARLFREGENPAPAIREAPENKRTITDYMAAPPPDPMQPAEMAEKVRRAGLKLPADADDEDIMAAYKMARQAGRL